MSEDKDCGINTRQKPRYERTKAKAEIESFESVHPKAVDWVWPERIALGKLTLIVGDPGLGKSLIGLALLTHVSRGTPWPVDKSLCKLGSGLLLSAEDDPDDTIRPRLDASGANVSRVSHIKAMKDTDPDTGEPFDRCFSLKKDIQDPIHVVDSHIFTFNSSPPPRPN